MKIKHIISGACILTVLGLSTFADATIYLMKGDKVVATYADDAVDYITFDAPEDPNIPSETDVDSRSFFMISTYFGDTQQSSGYNYALRFLDKPYDQYGNIPNDAIYFYVELNGPAPADKETPALPNGIYTWSDQKGLEYSIYSGATNYVVDHNSKKYFTNARMVVESNNGNQEYNFYGVAEDGTTYHSVYSGTPDLHDQSIDWLEADQHIQGGDLRAWYNRVTSETDADHDGANVTITIAEKGYDDGGWLVTPSNYLTFVGNVEMDEFGAILPNTWTITTEGYAQENQFLAGKCIDFMGSAWPVNTTIKHYRSNSDSDVSVGLIVSGTLELTKSKGTYNLVYNLETDKGKKVTGVWSGPKIVVDGHPYADSLKLEEDVVLDFSTASGTCYDWGYEVLLEVATLNDDIEYEGDRVELTLFPNDEFTPGIYKVNPDDSCVGEMATGTFFPSSSYGEGSVYVKYSREEPGKILKATGISDGKVEVIKNDDDSWTIKYDLYDTQDEPRHISGSWTGELDIW